MIEEKKDIKIRNRIIESEDNFRRVQVREISIYTGGYTYDRLNKIDQLNIFLGKIPAKDIITITQQKDSFFIFFKTNGLEYKICSLCGHPMKWIYADKKDKWKSKSFCPECDKEIKELS